MGRSLQSRRNEKTQVLKLGCKVESTKELYKILIPRDIRSFISNLQAQGLNNHIFRAS